jgi:hypothetical protein
MMMTTYDGKECRRAMEGTQQSAGEPVNDNNNKQQQQ